MAATVKSWKRAVELERKVSGSRSQEYSVWAAPATFCAVRYITDSWYLERDKKRKEAGKVGARMAIVQFTTSRAV